MKRINHWKFAAALSAAAIMASGLPLMAAETDRKQQQDRTSLAQPERLNRLLGSEVMSSDRERLGQLNNVVLDLESGSVLFALIGSRDGRVAVPPGVFANTRGDNVRLNINREQFRKAPRVTGDMMNREQLSQASFINRVYDQFGQRAWWRGDSPATEGRFNNVHAGENLTGMKVRNVMDKELGEIRNAVVDLPAGRVVYVVIEPHRDLNLDNRLLALPPNAFTLSQDRKSLVTDADREKLNSGPSFARNQWPNLTDQSFASRVYSHYGKRAYFESGAGSDLQPTGRETEERAYQEADDWRDRDRDRDRERDSLWDRERWRDRDRDRRDRSDW
jgi:sporulation protein YlmC with PRC-barrel domain